MNSNEQRTAVVLAGGGERVIAWQIGVLAGLADSGVDLRGAGAVVGTSAGAYVAARLAAGEDPRLAARGIAARDAEPIAQPGDQPFERLAQAFAAAGTVVEGRRRVGAVALAARTRPEREVVAHLADRLPTEAWPEALHVVAVDAERGERLTMDVGTGVSLAAGVAASRAVPVALPPVSIAGRRLIDGAVGSATNADVVLDIDPPIDRVIVIAATPVATAGSKLAQLWDEALRAELWQLDAAEIETYIVRASVAELELMGPDMMSGGAAPLAVRAGHRAGQAVGPALRALLEPRVAAVASA